MSKRILMVAFHFPPFQGSSGIQRTLRFVQHLPALGWDPVVLSASPRAYPSTSDDQLADVPAQVPVRRAFALDASRQLALKGRYLRATALPDRWVSWWAGAIPAGLSLVRRYRPDVIWSTYPIATAHMIGRTLHRLTGLPWVADFRDSMTEPGYPPDPAMWRSYRKVEAASMRSCDAAVFTTPGTLAMYAERYPDVPVERMRVIENGYDEASFLAAEEAAGAAAPAAAPGGALTLVHSGSLNPGGRDPVHLFKALGALKRRGEVDGARLQVLLRASGHEAHFQRQVDEEGVGDIVRLAPAVGYRAALAEMLHADGLLAFQGTGCNHQVPAKIYEYLRARKPVLGITDPVGDTAGVLRRAGIDTIVRLDDADDIARGVVRFLGLVREGRAPLPSRACIEAQAREHRASELAEVLGGVLARADAPQAA